MPEDVLALVLPVLGWGLLSLMLNLAFGYKSQIEAWAESHPRVAGLLKLTRALGLDPWNALAALKLLAQKRLPEVQKSDSAIARNEQRKADAKRLGDDDGPPPPVSRYMPPLSILCLVLLIGCSHLAKEAKDPCSEVTLTTIQVGCESRIERECAAGDKTCPAYVECSRAIKTWRACP